MPALRSQRLQHAFRFSVALKTRVTLVVFDIQDAYYQDNFFPLTHTLLIEQKYRKCPEKVPNL
jgi:hypothetical protein